MLVLIWIQTVRHPDIVPERFFLKLILKKKTADNSRSIRNYPATLQYSIVYIAKIDTVKTYINSRLLFSSADMFKKSFD